jgi:hypothetical protein
MSLLTGRAEFEFVPFQPPGMKTAKFSAKRRVWCIWYAVRKTEVLFADAHPLGTLKLKNELRWWKEREQGNLCFKRGSQRPRRQANHAS